MPQLDTILKKLEKKPEKASYQAPKPKPNSSKPQSKQVQKLQRELEEKDQTYNHLNQQLKSADAEADEKINAIKQEVNSQDDRLKEFEEESKIEEELENLVANYNETVTLYEKCMEEVLIFQIERNGRRRNNEIKRRIGDFVDLGTL